MVPKSALAIAKSEAKRVPGDPWTLGRPSDRLGDGVGWQWPGEKKKGGRAGHFNPKTQGTGNFNPGAGTVTSRQADGMVATTGKDNDAASGRNDGPGKPMFPGGPMHSTYRGPVTTQDIWNMQPPHIWMVISCCVGVCLLIPCLAHANADDEASGPENGLGAVGSVLSANACCAIVMGLAMCVACYALVAFCYQFGAWGLVMVAFVLGAILVLTSLKPLSGEEGSGKGEGMMLHQSLVILGLLLVLGTVLYFLSKFGFFSMLWRFHVMIWHNWWAYGLVFLVVLAGCCCFLRSNTAGEMAKDYQEEWNAVQPRPDGPGFRSVGEAIQSMG